MPRTEKIMLKKRSASKDIFQSYDLGWGGGVGLLTNNFITVLMIRQDLKDFWKTK